jgi:hypothetical protein
VLVLVMLVVLTAAVLLCHWGWQQERRVEQLKRAAARARKLQVYLEIFL